MCLYKPLIAPATLSTASFSFTDACKTSSLSSSAHSAMNVAVSDAKPASVKSASQNQNHAGGENLPSILPACAVHNASEQDNASSLTLVSSERVCKRTLRLMDLRTMSSEVLSVKATRHCSSNDQASAELWKSLTHTGICWMRGPENCRTLSSCQKTR